MIEWFIAESTIKWSHVNQEDHDNDLIITQPTVDIINALVELNNVNENDVGVSE